MSETEKFNKLCSDLNNLRRSVLVVEDEKYDIELAVSAFDDELLRNKFFVDIARNGQEAIDRLVRYGYDVIFLDLKLPVKDGVEVLEYCRDNTPLTPIIIITAHEGSDLARRAPLLSYVGVVSKPLTKTVVIEILRKHKLLM